MNRKETAENRMITVILLYPAVMTEILLPLDLAMPVIMVTAEIPAIHRMSRKMLIRVAVMRRPIMTTPKILWIFQME